METEWNNNHHPTDQIGLKKRMPLPFFKIGSRKSVQIDKKGLFWLLREYERAGGNLHHVGAPPMPSEYNSFKAIHYRRWVKFIFCIDKVLDGRKIFKPDGVGITTSGVSASIHYYIPRPQPLDNRNVPDPDPDEESLLQSIGQLSLNPPDEDVVDMEGGRVTR